MLRFLLYFFYYCAIVAAAAAAVLCSAIIVPPQINHIQASSLFVSEPNPRDFGNPPNPTPQQHAVRKHWGNANKNWLKSRFHFNFAEYDDPARRNFGVLRVLNDDLVMPARGFHTHPHSNVEVVSLILGPAELTHGDSLGNSESLGRGSVQYISAGSGISHEEHNRHPTLPVRWLQIWFSPRRYNQKPRYGSWANTSYDPEERRNKFYHIVGDELKGFNNLDSSEPSEAPVRLQTDVNVFIAEIDPSSSTEISSSSSGGGCGFPLSKDRAMYVVCAEGECDVQVEVDIANEEKKKISMKQHDGLSIATFNNLPVKFSNPHSKKKNFVVVIEMKNPNSSPLFSDL